jgi:hypothetical protein
MQSMSDDDREALASAVVARLRETDDGGRYWLTTAGGVVGLIAGGVALVYVLGGLVFALRLMLDGSSLAEAVALVGQLSREFLITAGLIEVVGSAAIVGLAAGLLSAALGQPKPPESPPASWPSLNYRLRGVRTWAALIPVGFLLVVPAIKPLLDEDRQSIVEIVSLLAGFALSYAAVCAGWYGLRELGTRLGRKGHRRERAAKSALLWLGMSFPAAIMFASFIGLEDARVCLRGDSTPVEGTLVADTGDAVLLTRSLSVPRMDANGDPVVDQKTGEQLRREDETVVRIPADQLAQLDYGADSAHFPACPKPAASMGG